MSSRRSSQSLSEKTLVMLVAPSAMGKSTVMQAATQLDPDFSYVRSFTTRPPRLGEETYTFLDTAQVKSLRARGEAITYTVFPTTGFIYGTTLESYQSKYNLLDTLANSVDQYRALQFEKTITMTLTAPVERWQTWFLARYPEESDEAYKRLEEAKLSIKWSLNDPETLWLVNNDTPEDVAKSLIKEVLRVTSDRADPTTGPVNLNAISHAHAILNLVEKGAVWL